MDSDSTQVKRGRGRPRKNPLPEEVVINETPKKNRRPKMSKTLALILIVMIAAVVVSGYFYKKYRDTQNKLNNPTAAAQSETSALVAKVGKLVELPSGEAPTIATVSDVSKLSGQTFFESAKNGDKVLIYSKAKKAILYRPSTNKVVNVAPLNVNSDATSGQTTGQ